MSEPVTTNTLDETIQTNDDQTQSSSNTQETETSSQKGNELTEVSVEPNTNVTSIAVTADQSIDNIDVVSQSQPCAAQTQDDSNTVDQTQTETNTSDTCDTKKDQSSIENKPENDLIPNPMDTTDELESNAQIRSEQIITSVPAQYEMGERQLILQQTQAENGEIMFVLQGENGEQIAIPPEALSTGLVQLTDNEGHDQLITLALPNEEQQIVMVGGDGNGIVDSASVVGQSAIDVSADILNNLGAASITIPSHQSTLSASTNVVQSIETPRVSTQESVLSPSDLTSQSSIDKFEEPKSDSKSVQESNLKGTEIEQAKTVEAEIQTKSDATEKSYEDKQTDKEIVDSESIQSKSAHDQTGAVVVSTPSDNSALQVNSEVRPISNDLETLVANALATNVDTPQNYVIMTAGDNQLEGQINLNEINSANETFYLQTPEGLVACTASSTAEDGTIQILTGNVDAGQLILQQQPVTSQQAAQTVTITNDTQLIQTINEGGSTFAYTIAPKLESGFSELSVSNVSNAATSLAKSTNVGKVDSHVSVSVPHSHKSEGILIQSSTKSANSTPIRPVSYPIISTNPVSVASSIVRKKVTTGRNPNRVQPVTAPTNVVVSKSAEHAKTIHSNVYQMSAQSIESSQLSASRKTYSRKNIVWLNPVQTGSKMTSTPVCKSPKSPAKQDKGEIPIKLDESPSKGSQMSISIVRSPKSTNKDQLEEINVLDASTLNLDASTLNDSNGQIVKLDDCSSKSPKSSKNATSTDQCVVKSPIRIITNPKSPNKIMSPIRILSRDSSEGGMKTIDKIIQSPKSNKIEIVLNANVRQEIKRGNPIEVITLSAADNKAKEQSSVQHISVCPKKRFRQSSLSENNGKNEMNAIEANLEQSPQVKPISTVTIVSPVKTQATINAPPISERSESGRRKSPIKPLKESEFEYEPEYDHGLSFKESKFERRNARLKSPDKASRAHHRDESEFRINVTLSADRSDRSLRPRRSSFIQEDKDESDVDSYDEEPVAAPLPVKRKVGRPPKNPILIAKAQAQAQIHNQSQNQTDANKIDTTPKPTPRRGRPPKRKLDVNAGDTPSAEGGTDKKSNTGEQQTPEVKECDNENNKRDPNVLRDGADDEASVRFDLVFNSNKNNCIADKQTETSKNIDDSFIDLPAIAFKDQSSTKRQRLSDDNLNNLTKPQDDEPGLPAEDKVSSRSVEYSLSNHNSCLLSYKDADSAAQREQKRKRMIDSVNDTRTAEEVYDERCGRCTVHVRIQTGGQFSQTNPIKASKYMCSKCGFQTNRMNILIMHHRNDCLAITNQMMLPWVNELPKSYRTNENQRPMSKKRRILNGNWQDECVSFDSEDKSDVRKSPAEDFVLPFADDDDDDAEHNLNKKLQDNKSLYGFDYKDIVWVDWNNVKWPALVLKINSPQKQALVKLVENNHHSDNIIIDLDSVVSFDQAERNIKFLEDAKKSYGDEIITAVQKAEYYTRKCCLDDKYEALELLKDIAGKDYDLLKPDSFAL